jgi:hypothetical protein
VSVFVDELSLSDALAKTARDGWAYVGDALDPAFRERLWSELRAGPWQRFDEPHGRVRMQIEGFDLTMPMDDFPAIAALRDHLEVRVRTDGRGIRGLATWRPNEAGAVLYRPGAMGISAHMDGRWYRRLVVVLTVRSIAPFSVHAEREGPAFATWTAEAGGMTFMRGPGLAGVRDGRPFHSIPGPKRGMRCSLALRMSVRQAAASGSG